MTYMYITRYTHVCLKGEYATRERNYSIKEIANKLEKVKPLENYTKQEITNILENGK